jgi:chromosome segregation ATPase
LEVERLNKEISGASEAVRDARSEADRLRAKLDEMHGEWQGAMSETSGKAEDLERRLRTGQENAARELETVKRQAEEAAVNGRARIQAAEEEIERMRRNAMDAELADAAAREFQEALKMRDGELQKVRSELDGARAKAKSNATLAKEAAERLRKAESVVDGTRRAAARAMDQVKLAENAANQCAVDAAGAARDREDAMRHELAEAERRYESMATQARDAFKDAASAVSERDAKIADLEYSLSDLERKSKEAVSTASNAVASAEKARRGAEEHAARSAADAAATYMRLESSLSQAEAEVQRMESAMLSELRSLAGHRGHGVDDRATGPTDESGSDAKIAELDWLCGQLAGLIRERGMTPGASSASTPRTVDALELVAAQMWAQLEAAGVDPSKALRR